MMANGKGCTCNAQGEHECACDADWTPQELIDARSLIASLKRCGTCRHHEPYITKCGLTRDVKFRADTCDKWEIDENETD